MALSLTHDFDPAVSTMTFRIGLSDDVEFGLLPPLLRALRQEAPKVVFVVQHVDYWRIPDLLAVRRYHRRYQPDSWPSGQCQAQIAAAHSAKHAARRCLRYPLTLDEYCSRPHVLVSHTANVSGFADEWLAEIGRTRHVVLSVPQYSALPALLAGTDLIASLPDYTAEAMAASGSCSANRSRSRRRRWTCRWSGSAMSTPTRPSAGCARGWKRL